MFGFICFSLLLLNHPFLSRHMYQLTFYSRCFRLCRDELCVDLFFGRDNLSNEIDINEYFMSVIGNLRRKEHISPLYPSI